MINYRSDRHLSVTESENPRHEDTKLQTAKEKERRDFCLQMFALGPIFFERDGFFAYTFKANQSCIYYKDEM